MSTHTDWGQGEDISGYKQERASMGMRKKHCRPKLSPNRMSIAFPHPNLSPISESLVNTTFNRLKDWKTWRLGDGTVKGPARVSCFWPFGPDLSSSDRKRAFKRSPD